MFLLCDECTCFKPTSLIGLDDVTAKISSTPLMDKRIQARRPVVLLCSVLLENVSSQKCTKDWLDLYLTNRSISGIESYKEIQILENRRVIVHLNNKNGNNFVLLSN